MDSIKRFKVGETYTATNWTDHTSPYEFTILKRTEKQVTFIHRGKPVTKGITIDGKKEICYPLGKHSMCPVIRA